MHDLNDFILSCTLQGDPTMPQLREWLSDNILRSSINIILDVGF
jgi:hypothetical protein